MANKPILVHIGYHKTASSWLQANLFEGHGFKKYFAQADIRDRLILPRGFDFDASDLRAYYDSLVDGDKVSVISNERLCGNPHSGGYDSKELADRLYASFPEAKVLIVVREQLSAILSTYIQYVRVGGPCSIEDYLAPPSRNQSVMPAFDFAHFDYLPLVKYYYEKFGREQVLVLPFELFKQDPADFCSQITDLVGLPQAQDLPYVQAANKRISSSSSIFLRQSNKLFAKTRLNPAASGKKTVRTNKALGGEGGGYNKIIALDALIPGFVHDFFDARLKRIIVQKVGDRYQASNQELAGLLDYNLASLDWK